MKLILSERKKALSLQKPSRWLGGSSVSVDIDYVDTGTALISFYFIFQK